MVSEMNRAYKSKLTPEQKLKNRRKYRQSTKKKSADHRNADAYAMKIAIKRNERIDYEFESTIQMSDLSEVHKDNLGSGAHC